MTRLDLIELARSGSVHFMGVGGAGMGPLAELVLRSGGQVSGCDLLPGSATAALASQGAQIYSGHEPAHVADSAALVVTSAVPQDHPELQAARRRGIPILKRAEALGSIVNRGTVIGIAGTHGKTSTTALTTAALIAAGLNPTALVGGRVPAWRGNLRLGGTRFFVVEADEYDRSFLTLHPHIAVVTTLEADHLDTYGSLGAVEDAFAAFADRVPDDGRLIACADDRGVGRLLPRLAGNAARVLTYGARAGTMLRIEGVLLEGQGSRFQLRLAGKRLGRLRLRVPGMHNVRNATAAAAVAHALGGSWEIIAEGLAEYSGVERRFELVGEVEGVRIIDDYAHHPTEILATLEAAHSGYPQARILAVFQPHLYSRTRDFADEFGRALARADRIFVTDVFAAREAPLPGVSGELIAEAARRHGGQVTYHAERATVGQAVAAELRPGDLCLTLGAGDLNVVAREIVALLNSVPAG